ncbi:hypothetical protein WJX81_005569 [Elliptochloris bilobata]|uniref:N-acetyltransferase domain-containing protein n=1 Tax=Elliptochloris bilobata TaxID=381761 RepID=A0AAW1S755_9CHLO
MPARLPDGEATLHQDVVQQAVSDEDVRRCFAVMCQLRVHLASEDDLLQRVRRMEVAQGYKLAYAENDEGTVVGVAGYAFYENIERADPKHLFVHDLVTSAEVRGEGWGGALLEWLEAQARASGCSRLVLDSNTERQAAHRFYHAHGLTIRSFHFAKDLD